ncbi:MAG: hypothetical protein JWM34_2198 [Ilumatobacteraceae bacterium]|nr:hypothetical protein [Ilumatobacteraceae bacterium]
MSRSRRSILASAALVVGLAACGSAQKTTSASTAATSGVTASTVAGSTATTTVGTGTGDRPVIHIGGNVGSGGDAVPAATGAATTGETRIAFNDVTYVFDGTLPTLPDSGASWSFPAGYVPDQARIASMAAALGVTGDVTPLSADQGGGWIVGPQDYSAAVLSVSPDALGSWYFSPTPAPVPDATTASGPIELPVPDTATPGSDGGAATVAVPITDPTAVTDPAPPVGVPDQAGALAEATTLFTQLGYDTSDYSLQYSGDAYSATVTASLLLGGQPSSVTMSLGFGAEGALQWGYGSLAVPVAGADYPLVGPQKGLDRLNDQADHWANIGARGVAEPMHTDVVNGLVAGVTASATASGGGAAAEPSGAASSDPVAQTEPCDPAACGEDPAKVPMSVPCDPAACPTPDPITIHLTTVAADTTMVDDNAGTAWILPAYTFGDGNPDDGTYTVLAVDDQYLDLTPPAVPLPESTPIDTAVPDTAVPVPDSAVSMSGPAPIDTAVPVPDTAIAPTPATTPKTAATVSGTAVTG